MKLSQEQVDRFAAEGFLVVKGMLDRMGIAALAERAEWIASGTASHIPAERLQREPSVKAGPATAPTFADSLRKMSRIAFADEVFQEHARSQEILDVVEGLLGPDIKLYQDQLFMKPARVGSRQPYHQDQPLGVHVDPPDMVTCWAPMDRASVENGCLWVLPGTHRSGVIPKEKWKEYEAQSLAGQLTGEEKAIELEVGDCSFHHGLLLHSSRANSSPQRRRGYATHYVSSHCRYTGPSGKSDALLMRGRSIPGRV